MGYRTIETNDKYLHVLNNKCKRIYVALKIFFILCIVVWITLFGLSLFHSFAESAPLLNSATISVFFVGGIIAALLYVVARVYKDLSYGGSPFCYTQVKRLKLVSLLLVVYFFIDLALSFFSVNHGLSESLSVSATSDPVFSINIAILIAVLVTYGMAIVFEYGTKLQEDSDATI